jgi:hypothetical protein
MYGNSADSGEGNEQQVSAAWDGFYTLRGKGPVRRQFDERRIGVASIIVWPLSEVNHETPLTEPPTSVPTLTRNFVATA